MRLEHAALDALARTQLRALVRERKRRLADEREHDLRLVALVDVLHDPLPVPDLRGRQRVHRVP